MSIFLLLAILKPGLGQLPWRRWPWSDSQDSIAYLRRHENMPVQTPGGECKCPPYKECVVDFKLNEDAIDFLNIRGVLKEDDVQKIKEDIDKLEPVKKVERMRRNNNERPDGDETCCCPPRNILMPTFITENKFNETLNKLTRNVNN